MADPAIVKRVRALMARATDPGATEEEQRTSAHIAAKLCKQHGIGVAELEDEGAADPFTRQRAEVTIDGVRTVIETINAGVGFDLFGFARGLMQDVLRENMQRAASSMRTPAPAPKRRKVQKRPKAKPLK